MWDLSGFPMNFRNLISSSVNNVIGMLSEIVLKLYVFGKMIIFTY